MSGDVRTVNAEAPSEEGTVWIRVVAYGSRQGQMWALTYASEDQARQSRLSSTASGDDLYSAVLAVKVDRNWLEREAKP